MLIAVVLISCFYSVQGFLKTFSVGEGRQYAKIWINSQLLCLGPSINISTKFDLPIVVLEGQNYEIAFESTEEITGEDARNNFLTPDDSTLYLTVGNTTWFKFTGSNGQSRSENWEIQWWKGDIQNEKRAFGMRVRHASKKDK